MGGDNKRERRRELFRELPPHGLISITPGTTGTRYLGQVRPGLGTPFHPLNSSFPFCLVIRPPPPSRTHPWSATYFIVCTFRTVVFFRSFFLSFTIMQIRSGALFKVVAKVARAGTKTLAWREGGNADVAGICKGIVSLHTCIRETRARFHRKSRSRGIFTLALERAVIAEDTPQW